ncbi:MAG: hypothetical protein COA78_38345 [Blastopirellula sp.]|nr:MAG: hypothetical protein COA78_38345 [Blastopirellula sp.]
MQNKEYKALHKADAKFIDKEVSVVDKSLRVRHLIFTAINPDDNITIPLCGKLDVSPVATSRIHRVTCRKCLETAKRLATLNTHDEALTFVTGQSDTMLSPDLVVIAQQVNGKQSAAGIKHEKAKAFMESKMLKSVDQLATMVIGTQKSTYYSNLLSLGLILGVEDIADHPGTDIGDTNEATMTTLQEQLDGLPAE